MRKKPTRNVTLGIHEIVYDLDLGILALVFTEGRIRWWKGVPIAVARNIPVTDNALAWCYTRLHGQYETGETRLEEPPSDNPTLYALCADYREQFARALVLDAETSVTKRKSRSDKAQDPK